MPKKYKFRLRSGIHIDVHPQDPKLPEAHYVPGAIIHTDIDLAARFGEDRYERILDGREETVEELEARIVALKAAQAQAAVAAENDEYTDDELDRIIQEEEIAVPSGATKVQKLAALKAAEKAANA